MIYCTARTGSSARASAPSPLVELEVRVKQEAADEENDQLAGEGAVAGEGAAGGACV